MRELPQARDLSTFPHLRDKIVQLQGVPEPIDQIFVVVFVQTTLLEVHLPGLFGGDVENQRQEESSQCATPVFAVSAKEQDIPAVQHSSGC